MLFAGLFSALLLNGCQTTAPPQEVALKFWQALAQGQIENARMQTSQGTQAFVTAKEIDFLSPISTGKVVTEDDSATVVTTINRSSKPITFNTALLMEDEGWKVDFTQTQANSTMMPFAGIAKSLQELGATFAKQLEQQIPLIEKELQQQMPLIEKELKQQIPLIEKEMETLGNRLKDGIEKFDRSLKKSIPP